MHTTSNSMPTVLVVDDEPLRRLGAMDVVGKAGFVVLEASDAAEDLPVCNGGVSVDVEVTDGQIPSELDGIGLRHTLRRKRPGTAAVVASGAFRPTARDLPNDIRLLAKPHPTRVLKNALFRLAA